MIPGRRDRHQFERLVFFSDAVFAIAITLLVIDLRLPEGLGRGDAALGHALLDLIPRYIGLVVSFFVIGRFWSGHHDAFGYLAAADGTLVWRNLLLLFGIVVMPFPTALLGGYPQSRLAIAVYAGWLLLTGLANRHLLHHALRQPDLAGPDLTPGIARSFLTGSLTPILIGLMALSAAMVDVRAALVALVASPLLGRVIDRRARRQAAGTA